VGPEQVRGGQATCVLETHRVRRQRAGLLTLVYSREPGLGDRIERIGLKKGWMRLCHIDRLSASCDLSRSRDDLGSPPLNC